MFLFEFFFITKIQKNYLITFQKIEYYKTPIIESNYQIIIDDVTQSEILSKANLNNKDVSLNRPTSLTTNHYYTNFNSAERLCIYEHVLNEAKKKNFPFDSNSWDSQTFMKFDDYSNKSG